MLGGVFRPCFPDWMHAQIITMAIKPQNPNLNGDLATMENKDDQVDASLLVRMLLLNRVIAGKFETIEGVDPSKLALILLEETHISSCVYVEIDGNITAANSIVYGIKDKKPYLRISNHMVDRTKTTEIRA